MLITRDFKLPVPGKKVYSYLRETAEKKLIDSMDQSALVQEFSKSFDSERATIRRRRTWLLGTKWMSTVSVFVAVGWEVLYAG